MTKVIIDRTKWSRGNLAANALLINRDAAKAKSSEAPSPKVGHMCCLGFACLAKGVSKRRLSGVPFPSCLEMEVEGLSEKHHGFYQDTDFAEGAASINDDGNLTESERERELIELAAKNGFEFQFIN